MKIVKNTKTSPAFLSQWIIWVKYLALLWSGVYGILGIYWALGGAGFPFGENDQGENLALLRNATKMNEAAIIMVFGFLGAVIAILMLRRSMNRLIQLAMEVFSIGMAVVLFFVIPDFRLLAAIAYTPIIIIGAPFNWFSGVNLTALFPWPVINQGICVIGGLIWASAALVYYRQMKSACLYCGRKDSAESWTTPSNAIRWGKWATNIAVAIPLIYSITRYAWALGIPLGINSDFFRQGQSNHMWTTGAGLATVAVCGSILTLGLIKPWGEIFPAWMLGLAGKTVPPALAIIPAALVSVIITAAGLNFIGLFTFNVSENLPTGVFKDGNWAAIAPEMFWPLWGIALGLATLAYYYRRRGRCNHCGLG